MPFIGVNKTRNITKFSNRLFSYTIRTPCFMFYFFCLLGRFNIPIRFIKPSPIEFFLSKIDIAYKNKGAIGKLRFMKVVIYIGINLKTVDFSHLPARLPQRLYRCNLRKLHVKFINNFVNTFEITSIRPINTL